VALLSTSSGGQSAEGRERERGGDGKKKGERERESEGEEREGGEGGGSERKVAGDTSMHKAKKVANEINWG
jgi:hypothetical protein